MNKNHPLYARYQKIFLTQLEVLQKSFTDLRQNYDLKALEILRRELNKFTRDAENFESEEVSTLCLHLECEVVEKITNFHHLKAPETWFDEMDDCLNKIKNTLNNKS